MQGVSIVNTPLQPISSDSECKLTISSNSAEITVLKHKPHDFKCLKLSGNTYVNQRTGEILDYSLSDDNTKSLDSMRKTFKRLNHLIIDNFSGGQSEIFLTLGYEYVMSDIKQLSHDFNLFWRKLKRRYADCEYISVAEYKGNQSLHLHIFIKSLSDKKLFFDRDLIIRLWGHSDVYIERIPTTKDVERIAKYLNPFTNPKKFRRLIYYERNFRIYNCSHGISKPETVKMSFGEAVQYMQNKGYIKHSEKAYDIVANLDDKKKIILNNVKKLNFRRNKNEK